MLRNKIRIMFLLVIMVISMTFGEPLTVRANTTTTQTTTTKVNNTKKKSKSKKTTKKTTKKNTKKSKKKKASKKKSTKKITKKISSIKSTPKKSKVKAKKKAAKYSASDLRLLSALIFCEAGGDYYGCYAGKKAVGIVVMNRVKSGSFPNDMTSVIYQRGQFSCTGSFLNSALSKYDNGTLGTKCVQAAKEVLSGSRSVDYNGKTTNMDGYLFFSRYVAGAKFQIESHQFK